MPGDRGAAEARLEALEEGFGQRDFGEQHQRLFSLAQAFGDRLEIDLGLAGTGDAVEQDRIEPFADCCRQARGRFALVVVEVGRREIGIGAGERPVGVDRDRFERAGIDQPAHHCVADLGVIGQLAHGALSPFDRGERLFALRRQPVGDEPGRPIFGELARTVERGRRRQHHPQHRGEGAEVIIGGPFAQPPQRRGEGTNVDHARRADGGDCRRPPRSSAARAPTPRRAAAAVRAARRPPSQARPACRPARDSRAGPARRSA